MNQNEQTILLVDDDGDDIELLREAIEALGTPYRVEEAHNGEEALRWLMERDRRQTLPSLIILDINMPRMDGKQTLGAIKRHPRLAPVPVVAFSTSSSPLDKLFFAGYGVEYITKPHDIKALLTIATKLLSYCSH